MAYKNLASFPDWILETWNIFLNDPDHKLVFGEKAQATALRHRLYSCRRMLLKEALPIGQIYEEFELIVTEEDGLWILRARRSEWISQIRAKLAELRGDKP